MRQYILISLWCEDDAATKLSHSFATKLHGRRCAIAFVSGEAPQHDDLKSAAAAWPEAAIVIFAHGGKALSARRQGDGWINAYELAQILSGRRLYAFACSTFVPNPALIFSTFAYQAVSSCVGVFVGHAAPVMTPLADEPHVTEKMEKALFDLIECFIDGEDDQSTLRNLGKRHAMWDLPIELDLPSEDPQREGAFGWSSAAFLKAVFESLCVRTKADDMRQDG